MRVASIVLPVPGVRANLQQRSRGEDTCARHEGSFTRDRFRNHEGAPVAFRTEGHRERSLNGTQLAGQSELAREFELGQQIRRQLPRRGEDADGDRQVEASALLGKVRGREVHRHAAIGAAEVGGVERRAHAIARFPHFLFGQSHDVRARKSAAHVHFHTHEGRIQARERATEHDGEGHASLKG
jgi:hypothetical protein